MGKLSGVTKHLQSLLDNGYTKAGVDARGRTLVRAPGGKRDIVAANVRLRKKGESAEAGAPTARRDRRLSAGAVTREETAAHPARSGPAVASSSSGAMKFGLDHKSVYNQWARTRSEMRDALNEAQKMGFRGSLTRVRLREVQQNKNLSPEQRAQARKIEGILDKMDALNVEGMARFRDFKGWDDSYSRSMDLPEKETRDQTRRRLREAGALDD